MVLEGSFVFSAADRADGGAGRIDVRTPVATINVERGRVAGRAAPEAELNLFTLVRNFDGSLGRALVSTTAGSVSVVQSIPVPAVGVGCSSPRSVRPMPRARVAGSLR